MQQAGKTIRVEQISNCTEARKTHSEQQEEDQRERTKLFFLSLTKKVVKEM